MRTYGYARVSTKRQKMERQVENIRNFCPEAVIYTEKQSGKDIEGRAVFRKLLARLKPGDTMIFDEVSRMSRNAEEGYQLYMKLMDRGINLVFLKEGHINTDEYKRRTQRHMERVSSANEKMDNLVNGILGLIDEFERENLKDNIRIAFQQAEMERQFLIKRVREGKAVSIKPQGRPKGSQNLKTEKATRIERVISEQSRNFDGKFSDVKIMREYLPGISRNTYYKYKGELVKKQKKIM